MRGFQDNSPDNGVTSVSQILLQSSRFVTPRSNTTQVAVAWFIESLLVAPGLLIRIERNRMLRRIK
jgi:hypothetical protein